MDENLYGNVNIDFIEKDKNFKKNYKTGPDKNLSSNNFLSHYQTPLKRSKIEDPESLIKPGEKPVKIGSLMGLEQVGQCLFIEYENDIIVIDAGLEFSVDDASLGADYVIPDITYLKRNRKKLRGILLTHGHLDHVGGLKDILPELGYPVVYTTPLTLGIVKKTFLDPVEAEKIKYKIINPETDIIKLGVFTIEFVRVNHNIPETLAMAIHTPKGLIFNSADFKIDHTPAIDQPADLAKIARIGIEGVKLYIGDSLGANRDGRSISEKTIGENIDSLIKNTDGRIIIATFSSNVGRVIQIINSAIRYGRYVFLDGKSMVNNVEICKYLGYINYEDGAVRKLGPEVNDYPDDKVLIIATGAQGEEFAALTRMARAEHNYIQLKKGDTVIMSSSTIPGNELSVKRMIDNLVLKGINLITNDTIDIHASGHGYKEDHKLFLTLLKPEFFLPYYMPPAERFAHGKLAIEMGLPESRILMPEENGQIIEMYDQVVLIGKKKIKVDKILIDGKGKGHLSGEYVIKARQIMAEGGVVVLIFKIDTKDQSLIGNIQIESRGFVFSSEVKEIHTKIVEFARKKYYENVKKGLDIKENFKQIKNDLNNFAMKIIGRVPMFIPTFVYINRENKKLDAISQNEAIVGMTLEEQGVDENKN